MVKISTMFYHNTTCTTKQQQKRHLISVNIYAHLVQFNEKNQSEENQSSCIKQTVIYNTFNTLKLIRVTCAILEYCLHCSVLMVGLYILNKMQYVYSLLNIWKT